MTDRLREMIIKRAIDMKKGYNIEGEEVAIFDKKYIVDCINGNVKEIK